MWHLRVDFAPEIVDVSAQLVVLDTKFIDSLISTMIAKGLSIKIQINLICIPACSGLTHLSESILLSSHSTQTLQFQLLVDA